MLLSAFTRSPIPFPTVGASAIRASADRRYQVLRGSGVEATVDSLIREERFILRLGAEEHILRIQERLAGSDIWPKPFRVLLPAQRTRPARRFYGASCLEVAAQAAAYLTAPARVCDALYPGEGPARD